MSRTPSANYFDEYYNQSDDEIKEQIDLFFKSFNEHCFMNKRIVKMMRTDFENAILYYVNQGTDIYEALIRLDPKQLGGFYSRPALAWYSLDDAAKIYPLSMDRGKMSIFRLSAYLKADVVPELLQMALNFTIRRFPSFATTLKKGFFWHYLDTAKRRFCVEEETDIPCRPMPISKSGSQSFRVLYYKNRISVEFFHVLTDGTGGMEFLKFLITEYLYLCGSDALVADAYPYIQEFENAFSKAEKADNASGFIDKKALQLSGKISNVKPCRLLHFNMDASELKSVAKAHNATVTAFCLALMFVSAKASCDETSGDISIQVPVDMRKYYPSKTLKNFSMYCGIRVPIENITTVSELLPEITKQLAEKTSKDKMSKMITSTQRMVGSLRLVPLFIKQPVAKMVYGFLGDQIFTTTLSNIGVVNLPSEISREVEHMDFVLGTTHTHRASCSMLTVNNTVTLSVSKNTADPSFEERLYELLLDEGLSVQVKGSDLYGH